MDDPKDEISQAHEDLDILGVPRTEGGLELSVAGRILLMARQFKTRVSDAALSALRIGAPGLSELTREGIARNISLRVSSVS